jgi:hypothetical protein
MRLAVGWFLSFTFAAVLGAQVTISPSAPPVIKQGAALTFTANMPVTWSLADGSAGSIGADGTYYAPVSIQPKQKIGGCQVLPNNHVYNTRIDSLPVHPTSTAWMALIPSSARPIYSPSWALNVTDNGTASLPMHFMYTPSNDGSFQFLDWPDLKRENGYFSSPLAEVDRHVVGINRDSCELTEVYNNYPAGTQSGCPTCTAQSGVNYPALSFDLAANGSVDAAGMYLLPLSLRLEEIRSGAINHALRFTLTNGILGRDHVWPATTHTTFPWGSIPYGTRFRLKSSFNISGFSALAQVLLTQLKQYGTIVADGGLNFDIQTMTDVTQDATVMAAFSEVGSGVQATDFEIVDESALQVSDLSGEVKPDNGYVTPSDYAAVVATNTANPSQKAQVGVRLQGDAVSVPETALWIQSGVTRQLTAWGNGPSAVTVRWRMNPPLGTLTSGGLYTAPQVSAPASTTITASSNADATATATINVTVMPAGPIRIDVGSSNDYVDSKGNTWWRDQASDSGFSVSNDCSYLGQNPWPSVPDIGLYYTQRYSLSDWSYRFVVPNGNYRITGMFAECGAAAPSTQRLFHVEANGQVVRHNYDVYASAGGASKPATLEVPVQVTDGILTFTLRRLAWPGAANAPWPPILNALLVEPEPSGARIAIDPENAGLLTPGKSVQFHAVAWYMSNSVTWAVTSGQGSIDANGLYTAPSTPVSTDVPVTITAVSAVDGSKTATATLTLTFGNLVISPAAATVVRSGTQQFSASIGGTNTTRVTWSVVPALGSISPIGYYTAPDLLAANTTVTVIATSTDDPTRSASAQFTVLAAPPPIRVNAGWMADFTDAQGRVWSKDYGYSTPTQSYNEGVPIANTTPDMYPLYQSSRYRYTDESFNYRFNVPNGGYRITLKFADYTFTEPGHYSFDVLINGTAALRDFDPDAAARASKTAVDRSFDVVVTNKAIQIDFIGHAGGAIINGIEIVPTTP